MRRHVALVCIFSEGRGLREYFSDCGGLALSLFVFCQFEGFERSSYRKTDKFPIIANSNFNFNFQILIPLPHPPPGAAGGAPGARDAVAVVRFLSWLERTVAAGQTISECAAAAPAVPSLVVPRVVENHQPPPPRRG